MIRLELVYIPIICVIVFIIQVILCILSKQRVVVKWLLPVLFLLLSVYGWIADVEGFPYPPIFAPDFMLSSALAGCMVFAPAFASSVIAIAVYYITRKLKIRK